ESVSRWTRLQSARGGASLRESATYWLRRARERRGDGEQAARQFGTLVRDAPRTYYGLLAAKRAPGAGAPAGASPFAFPADPLEALQGDAPFARAAAPRGGGRGGFADEELDDLPRRAVGEPRRLYAL